MSRVPLSPSATVASAIASVPGVGVGVGVVLPNVCPAFAAPATKASWSITLRSNSTTGVPSRSSSRRRYQRQLLCLGDGISERSGPASAGPKWPCR